MNSLFLRFQISMTLLILLTVFSHAIVDYYNSYREIPRLLTQAYIQFITQSLENSYNSEEGWRGLERTLVWLNQGNIPEDGDYPDLRIVVKDREGSTLYNSFALLSRWDDKPLIEASRKTIRNRITGEPVGSVAAYIERDYLTRETISYLTGSFFQQLLWSLAVLILISLLAGLFARRLVRPIRALTTGMERISHGDGSESLPVLSQDELGRMSQAFNDMAEALSVQKEMRKRLIGDISHDLGTPLNRIRLEARGIFDSLTSPDKGAVRIIEEVDKLKNLAADLDWLGETDSGTVRLNRKEIDLGKLVEEEIYRWRFKGEISRVSLDMDNRLPPGFVCSLDQDRTGEALGNLMDNAIKYSPPGGRIWIRCETDGNQALLSVKDEGPGIHRDDLPRIFERFYRADPSRTKEGRGLGLTIVERIMELHGGSVTVQSVPGEGSLFCLSFPC